MNFINEEAAIVDQFLEPLAKNPRWAAARKALRQLPEAKPHEWARTWSQPTARQAASALASAFIWAKTQHGHKAWSRVYRAILGDYGYTKKPKRGTGAPRIAL